MKKGRVSADFQEESTLHGNSHLTKEEIRPYSFAQVNGTENLGNGYQRSQLAKSQCICAQSSKIVFMNMVKKS
jgi:hypothetical protein